MKLLWAFQSGSPKFNKYFEICVGLFLVASSLSTQGWAAPQLPYTVRTHPFSGYSPTIRGDVRTVGMAGATVGLADAYVSALSNPAGLTMTMNTADQNFASNSVRDAQIQDWDQGVWTTTFGAAVNFLPWGLGIGYITSYQEGQDYEVPTAPSNPVGLSVTTREFHLSASRIFFDHHLSLGASLNLAQSQREVNIQGGAPQTVAHHSYTLNGTFGATLQLPLRILFAMSYTPPARYHADPKSNLSPAITDFFQPLLVPRLIASGLAWIPNRFFRMDFTTYFVGTTPTAGLIRNENIEVGGKPTVQPRLGIAYDFADFKEIHAVLFMGTYYETSRVQGEDNRLHFNAGFETKPWVLTLGLGIDRAYHYRNYIVSVGVDVIKVFAKLDLIPKLWHPPYGGLLSNPFRMSDLGLARPLVKDWVQKGPDIDPIQIGLDIPKKIAAQVEKVGEGIKSIVGADDQPKKRKHPKKTGKKGNTQKQKVAPSRQRNFPRVVPQAFKNMEKKSADPDSEP